MTFKPAAALLLALGVITLSHTIHAREHTFSKQVDPGILQKELVAKGFKVNRIECTEQRCQITMPDTEKKDPSPIINAHKYVDPIAARQKRVKELRALHARWEANTISPEEKEALIKEVIGSILGK